MSGRRSLAVVGAGVGGVTAAMVAVNAGVPTMLFELAPDPFSRHQTCGRWVDPTQYDWPLDHFPHARIPWPGTPSVPLLWPRADRATALVGDWRVQFNAFRLSANATRFFQWRHDAEVIDVRPNATGTMAEVEWQPVGHVGTNTDPFGMVITAMGFGDERSFLEYPKGHHPATHSFCGYPFWSDDPYESPRLSRTHVASLPRVLISGAGDGALQDFLRIATRFKSARDLWDHLALSPGECAAVQKEAQDIEDQANRAVAWSANSRHDHVVLDRLMQDYRILASRISAIRGIPAKLDSAIRREFATLWFVHVCSHFGQCYALNRLLVLLLMQRLIDTVPSFVYKPHYRLVEVVCHHRPGPVHPATCHWQPHRAFFWPKPNCDPDPAGSFPPPPPLPASPHPDQSEEEFDVIVIRHGIKAPAQLLTPTPPVSIPTNRQLLPYHHPG